MNVSKATVVCLSVAILAAVSLKGAQASLLSAAFETQLETWLGEGNLAFTNIYTRSTGDTSANFHAAVDLQGRTFTLFEARVAGSSNTWEVIGGYNPQSWDASIGGSVLTPNLVDRTAFLYNLSNPVKYGQRTTSTGQYQTNNHINSGPSWGGGTDLAVYGSLVAGHGNVYSYAWSPYPVGATHYTPLEYGAMEAYTIAPVPEPSSLFLVAMGVAGNLAMRALRRRPR